MNDLLESKKSYTDAKGIEKILAAQMLLGEGDLKNLNNFEIIEKDATQLFAKIDHGKSIVLCIDQWIDVFILYDFSLFEKISHIKVDFKILLSELNNFIEFISTNDQLIDQLIDRKVSNLNKILHPNTKGLSISWTSAFNRATQESFIYSDQSKTFISDKGKTFNYYLKEKLANQIKVIREYSEVLSIIAAISQNSSDVIHNVEELWSFKGKDPVLWAIKTNKKLDEKNPLIWAIENGKQIENKAPVIWATEKEKHKLKNIANISLIAVLAEVAIITNIHLRGSVQGMTEQQQSLYLKIVIAL